MDGNLLELFDRAEELGKVEIFNEGTAPFAAVPQGRTLLSLKKFYDEYRTRPERRAGHAHGPVGRAGGGRDDRPAHDF